MPFGRPIRHPIEHRACGCTVVKYTEGSEQVTSYCAHHWENLPAAKRTEIRRLQRKGFIDGAVTLLLRLAILVGLGYMVWTVYAALHGAAF